MSGRAIEAGNAFIRWSMKDSAIRKGLDRLEKRFTEVGMRLQSIGKIALKVGGVVTTAFAGAVATFASMGDTLDDMSLRTSLSAELLQGLGYAAEQSGANLTDLEKAAIKVRQTIFKAGQGSKEATALIHGLGLSVETLLKLPPDEAFLRVAEAFSKMVDPAKKATIAEKMFGKQFAKILPLFRQGEDGLVTLMQRARELGIILGEEDVKAAGEFADGLSTIRSQARTLAATIGAGVATHLLPYLKTIQEIAAGCIKWANANRPLLTQIATFGAIVFAAGAALYTTGTGFYFMGRAMGSLSTVVGMVGSLLSALLSPTTLVVAAVAAASYWFLTATETGEQLVAWLSERFASLLTIAQTTFGGIADAIAAGDMALAGEVLWAGLKLVWVQGTNWIMGLWNSFTNSIYTTWAFLNARIAEVFLDTWWLVQSAWEKTVNFIADVGDGIISTFDWIVSAGYQGWNNFVAGVQTAWVKIMAIVKTAMYRIDEYLQFLWNGSNESIIAEIQAKADAAVAEIDAARNKKNSQIAGEASGRENARAQAGRERNAASQSRLDQIDRDNTGAVQSLYDDASRKSTQSDQSFARKAEEAAVALKEAEQKLAESRAAAAAKAATASAEQQLAGRKTSEGLATADAGTGLGGLKTSTLFNVAGIQSLLAPGDDAVANNTARTADGIDKLVTEMRESRAMG